MTPAAIEALARQNKPHSVERRVDGLKVTPFALPDGCLGGYDPELNPLIPLWSHDQKSKTPASKSVPVRIQAWIRGRPGSVVAPPAAVGRRLSVEPVLDPGEIERLPMRGAC